MSLHVGLLSGVCPHRHAWQPSKEAASSAVALLWAIAPETCEINAEFTDSLEFRDPGDNWSGVRCPACDANLSSDWFGTTMIDWYQKRSDDLGVIMPCCRASSTLDALRFGATAAFYRFCLVMFNSMVIVNDVQIEQLEKCLGTKLKVIWTKV